MGRFYRASLQPGKMGSRVSGHQCPRGKILVPGHLLPRYSQSAFRRLSVHTCERGRAALAIMVWILTLHSYFLHRERHSGLCSNKCTRETVTEELNNPVSRYPHADSMNYFMLLFQPIGLVCGHLNNG